MSELLPKIGFHVSKSGYKTMAEALTAGHTEVRKRINTGKPHSSVIPSMQIFATGPCSISRELSETELDLIKRELLHNDVILVIHGAYVDNPWDIERSRIMGSIHNIKKEMRMAYIIGATGVIVHLGAKCNNSIEWVFDKIAHKLADEVKNSVVFYLEINAAKPTENTFETPEKLRVLFTKIADYNNIIKNEGTTPLKIGLCVDTAHLHSCGVTLTTAIAAREWFNAVPEVPIIVHLNDSKAVAGSGKDRHDHLGKGNIWGNDDSGLREIVKHCRDRSIPMILERDDPMPDLTTLDEILASF